MYPKWLPSPKAIGQALILTLEFIPVIIVGRVITVPLEYLPRNKTGFYFGIFLIIMSVLAMIYTLSMIHQLFWDKPRNKVKWFPQWRCLGEGVWGMFAAFLSALLGGIFTLAIYDRPLESDFERVVPIVGIIALSYCCHARNLVFKSKEVEFNEEMVFG